MRVTVALGTRPEVIKLAPVIRRLIEVGVTTRAVHTGQHTDPVMASALEAECAITVDERWELPTDSAARLGAVLEHASREFATHPCDAAIVLGDTWTVPLVGLAARSQRVPVVHVEAGLRSDNLCSTEEVNRRSAVAFASLHLAPTAHAAARLRAEGVDPDSVVVTGNPITDALATTGIERIEAAHRHGVLFTAHRATNVDDPARLAEIVAIVEALAATTGPVTFPVHPRTAARLAACGLTARLARAAIVSDPLPYRALLERLAAARLVVTDSGGLQEESAWFGVPTIVLRASTPRPEGVALGFARLAGVDRDSVLRHAVELTAVDATARIASLPCPYGDGATAGRIVSEIVAAHADGRLRLNEPVLDPANDATLDEQAA